MLKYQSAKAGLLVFCLPYEKCAVWPSMLYNTDKKGQGTAD